MGKDHGIRGKEAGPTCPQPYAEVRPLIRLIGIDVDGTLVGASGVVDPLVWDAAERARVAGIHLALCSGRAAFGRALEYAERLDGTGWHVFQNGASVLNVATLQSRSTPLPTSAVQTCIAQARRDGEVLELYSDREYVTESTAPWARAHADLLGVPFASRAFESLQGAVVRAQWLLSATKAKVMLQASYQDLEIAQSTSPLMPETQFVGLTRAGITKGTALQSIASEYGIDLKEVMYIGDSGNDLSALRIVGCPIAMANAEPAVIAAAVRTVAHVDKGGVAQALEFAITSR